MPKAIVLIGPPGAGKSTWREVYLAENPDTVVVSQDDLVDAWAAERGMTYTEAFRKAPMKEFTKQVKQNFRDAVSSGRDVILDRTNMTRKSRETFRAMAPHYIFEAVDFHVHPIVLEDRISTRARLTGKSIPRHVLRTMLANYEAPGTEFAQIHNVYSGYVTPGVLLRWALRRIKYLVRDLFKRP